MSQEKAKKSKLVLFLSEQWPLFLIASSIVFGCWYFHLTKYSNKNSFIYSLESKLLDERFLARGEVPSKTKIGVLAADDRAIQKFGRWPFRRSIYRQAFRNLKNAGVKWIGFDVVFSEPERATVQDLLKMADTKVQSKENESDKGVAPSIPVKKINQVLALSPGDEDFAESIAEFENIVLGYLYYKNEMEVKANGLEADPFRGLDLMEDSAVFGNPFGDKEISDYNRIKIAGITSNIDKLSESTSHFGYFSNEPDNDAIIRWVSLVREMNGQLMPSLALKLAAEYLDRDIAVFFDENGIESIDLIDREDDGISFKIPVSEEGKLVLNHMGHGRSSFPHISLANAFDGNFTEKEKEFLKGSILMLGATAIGINDQRPNPFDATLDGVENHAAALDNIINQDFFKRPSEMIAIELAVIFAIGFFFSPILIFSSAIWSGLSGLIISVGYYYFDKYYWFEQGIWAYIGMPYIEIFLLFISITLYKYAMEERQKRHIKGAFGHYLSPEVINELMEDPESLTLGGQRKELTVFFSDVRGFTTTSENLSPEELGDYMNEYFTPMTKIILDSKGVLDKYIGDAIMAFWGAPLPVENQADIACISSIKMLLALDKVQADYKQKGYPPIDIGIGLNTGPMSVGNFGSNDRFCYTVMGDSVNLGARLEGLTKQYGIKLMISEFTVEKITNKYLMYRDLDDIRVKGKNKPVKVFHLLRPDILPQETQIKELIGNFERGREFYAKKEWDEALKYFSDCMKLLPGDGPSKEFIDRINKYKIDPPPADWDGVCNFKTK